MSREAPCREEGTVRRRQVGLRVAICNWRQGLSVKVRSEKDRPGCKSRGKEEHLSKNVNEPSRVVILCGRGTLFACARSKPRLAHIPMPLARNATTTISPNLILREARPQITGIEKEITLKTNHGQRLLHSFSRPIMVGDNDPYAECSLARQPGWNAGTRWCLRMRQRQCACPFRFWRWFLARCCRGSKSKFEGKGIHDDT
jgi:hypothetical protein